MSQNDYMEGGVIFTSKNHSLGQILTHLNTDLKWKLVLCSPIGSYYYFAGNSWTNETSYWSMQYEALALNSTLQKALFSLVDSWLAKY